MALLSQFLKLLEWLETAQDFVYFLSQPAGFSGAIALCLFFPIQFFSSTSSLTAATLSCATALTLFCLLEEKPIF
ncbi:MAG: hypothetical protein WA947_22615 [Phormidesmis sp.]